MFWKFSIGEVWDVITVYSRFFNSLTLRERVRDRQHVTYVPLLVVGRLIPCIPLGAWSPPYAQQSHVSIAKDHHMAKKENLACTVILTSHQRVWILSRSAPDWPDFSSTPRVLRPVYT